MTETAIVLIGTWEILLAVYGVIFGLLFYFGFLAWKNGDIMRLVFCALSNLLLVYSVYNFEGDLAPLLPVTQKAYSLPLFFAVVVSVISIASALMREIYRKK